MKILLHNCCGPCTIYPLQGLRELGHQVHGYFFNPNIHPYTEWLKRSETLLQYASENQLPVITDDQYDLEGYLREVVRREAERCRYCYSLRLERAARVAVRGNFDAFTTTLLVSPYQKHDLIREIGMAIAKETSIPFYYADFRPGYREAVQMSRSLGMYRQRYCGCIYSEKERFYNKNRAKSVKNNGGW